MFNLPATRPYFWIALILDYGTFSLLLASPRLVQEFWSTSRFNLVSEYLGSGATREICLRLSRRGIFTIQLKFRRAPDEYGLALVSRVGTWRRQGARLILQIERESAVFDVISDGPTETLRLSADFPSWEDNHDLSLANISFVQTKIREA